MGGIKTFGIMLGTFAVVYLITPYVVQAVISWLPVEHPERVSIGVATMAAIAVYSLLRRLLGDKTPWI